MSGFGDAFKGMYDLAGWAKFPKHMVIQAKEWVGKKAWPEGTTTAEKNGFRGRVILLALIAAPFTMGISLGLVAIKAYVIARDH